MLPEDFGTDHSKLLRFNTWSESSYTRDASLEVSEVPPKIIILWPSNPIKIKLYYHLIIIACLFKYIPRTAEKPDLEEIVSPVVA